ncbi:TetR/AcrR family transcriptional regulator [Rhodococcus sp. BP-252]|uniref:TetR family transcriptional regulator n=1 Tax=Rhodococcoides kyotonense TaxID=398843 RepID=A0A177YK61_9NOCA|nr:MULTISPECIES: TetR/AcrR family transcriptional regulator [Rhodococcus]MBY6413181.1 TetR/AcrR family transcriptional regulator [Rhodococcus sp. BP-320]MBY6418660.1 TetR/AcrR family transcriptional regulator [Rhodococcus sp. BP-321]MBY6422954.1 TetR/AcrR family transcriptional regulator [Rhodococcus sp. BP-324]MBY6427924.1 TetR/AcrR family transcriptional regulator [Rhodococcus sp. BP-323]MBY6433102.1 TetR/AcrR family transcriptional regulator [Rhodococcus sp. BP-322]
MTTSRKRLSPTERRTQLLDIGSRLFADRPYDDVWIEEVADLAGVSRGLMYHYFPSKRDFFAEIIRVESVRILEITAPDTSLPVVEQVAAGLDAYIRYASEHEHGVRAINRGSILGDTEIQAIVTAEFDTQQQRILAALPPELQTELMKSALRGWVSFVRAVCLDWLDRRAITEEDVKTLCMRALEGLLAS